MTIQRHDAALSRRCGRSNTTNQWSADEGRRHAADASAHGRRSDADTANLGGKQFTRVDVDAGESDADEQSAEHREGHCRRVVIWI